MKKIKKWKYHTSYKFKDENDKEHTIITQLYQIGVYAIWDNDASMQRSYTPNQMVSLERKLKKAELNKEIFNLELGRSITVIEDENGLYKKLEL